MIIFPTDNEILSVLNNGSIKELKKLQGVGEKRARLIADWRTIHGPFLQVKCTVDDLGKIGLGSVLMGTEGYRE